ncbi:MAG: DNA-directed RNA polymerase subunit K [Candidatus Nanohaloarchaeota archaeon QJJ-5]|nr:DNA-directed RNA polymerase subunit K [Candidatus Nanohaloarchaeota archaeon QJJ-5]
MTTAEYTRFERARLIGARALQLSEGAPPLLEIDETDPIEVARSELEEGVLPISIKRESAGR